MVVLMPTIRDRLADATTAALRALGVDAGPGPLHLERPARREHGDWSTNVALTTSKATGRPPRQVATELRDHLAKDPPARVNKVEVAGPGFVNFYLDDDWLYDVLCD